MSAEKQQLTLKSRKLEDLVEKKIALEKERKLCKALNSILKNINDFVSDKFSEDAINSFKENLTFLKGLTEKDIENFLESLKNDTDISVSLRTFKQFIRRMEKLDSFLDTHNEEVINKKGGLSEKSKKILNSVVTAFSKMENAEKQISEELISVLKASLKTEVAYPNAEIEELEYNIKCDEDAITRFAEEGKVQAALEYEKFNNRIMEKFTSPNIVEHERKARAFGLTGKGNAAQAERLKAEAEMLDEQAKRLTASSKKCEKGSERATLFSCQAEANKAEANLKRNEAKFLEQADKEKRPREEEGTLKVKELEITLQNQQSKVEALKCTVFMPDSNKMLIKSLEQQIANKKVKEEQALIKFLNKQLQLEASSLLDESQNKLKALVTQTQESNKVSHKNGGFVAWLFEKIAGLFFSCANKKEEHKEVRESSKIVKI